MDSATKIKQVEWESCIENEGTYQLPFGKRQLCGARENLECPHLHPLKAFVGTRSTSRQLHVCTYRDEDEGWRDTLHDVKKRWDWVFARLAEADFEYDFRIEQVILGGEEQASFTQQDLSSKQPASLENRIYARYFEGEAQRCGYIFPTEKGNYALLSEEVKQRVFSQARGKSDMFTSEKSEGTASPISPTTLKEYTPSSMEAATVTPFPTREELAELAFFFVHDEPALATQKIIVPIGGEGAYARSVSLVLPYHAIYDFLAAQIGKENVLKVKFW